MLQTKTHLALMLATLVVLPLILPGQSTDSKPKKVAATHTRVHELNGFLLLQDRKAIEATLGKPFHDETKPDGSIVCAYRVPNSKEDYLVAIYSISKDLNYKDKVITLELTGSDPSGPAGFFGLQLGDTSAKIESVLGRPTRVSHEDDANVDLWDYKGNNYSLEFTSDHKLYSIEIADEASEDTPEPAGSREVRLFAQAIESHDIDKIMEMASGQIECSTTEDFGIETGSARSIFSDPKSKVSVCLRRAAEAILALGPQMKGVDEEIRIWVKHSPGTVTKFPASSLLKEIVIDQEAGAFRVYEVTFR